ncbi:unnamed protein product, partial [Prorocentrum cordatum]
RWALAAGGAPGSAAARRASAAVRARGGLAGASAPGESAAAGPCGSFATAGLEALPAPAALRAWAEALPPDFRRFAAAVEARGPGHRVWVVGGALRDLLSGAATPREVDLCTTLSAAEMLEAFPESRGTGEQFGTVTIHYGELEPMECTALRADSAAYSDGRRPDSVDFVTSLRLDLARRDFTVNAIALDVERLLVYDPFGGSSDCADGALRAVGEAAERLAQDGLRIMRGYRLLGAVAAGLPPRQPDAALSAALRGAGAQVSSISRERVTDELRRILGGHSPAEVAARMAEDGVLAPTLAELGPAEAGLLALGAWQRAGGMEVGSWLCPLALLLGPATDGAAEAAGQELKLTKKDQQELLWRRRCLSRVPDASDLGSVRCYMTALGVEEAASQLRLERAWAVAVGGELAAANVDAVVRAAAGLRPGSVAPRPLADGRWVMQEAGCKGPRVGLLKDWLYYEQVVRDVQDAAGMKAVLAELAWEDAHPGDIPRVAWPPGSG